MTAIPQYSSVSSPLLYLYAGNFNCYHVDWDYNANSPDGVDSAKVTGEVLIVSLSYIMLKMLPAVVLLT